MSAETREDVSTRHAETAQAYPDLCVSCSSAVKSFTNLKIAGDEKRLVPTWMPPGGCTCHSMEVDPSCPRCFPGETLCQPCGAA